MTRLRCEEWLREPNPAQVAFSIRLAGLPAQAGWVIRAVKRLHRWAMQEAKAGYAAQRAGDHFEAAWHFRFAHKLELQAAGMLLGRPKCDTARAILSRSAAALQAQERAVLSPDG